MNRSEQLLALAERCEAATGDRELDAVIASVLGLEHGSKAGFANNHNGDYFTIDECARPYTTSLEAAASLAKGWRIILNIAEDGITTAIVDGKQGCADTPALALCAQSRQSRRTPNDPD